MKKFISVILSAFLLLSAFTLLCGCGGVSTLSGKVDRREIVSAEDISRELKWFLGTEDSDKGNRGNRTRTSKSEREAAEKLHDNFTSDGYECFSVTPLELTEFDVTIKSSASTFTGTTTQVTRKSQNVEIKFGGNGKSGKQIIIGACYSNSYGSYDSESTGGTSTGAYDNATGVATVLAIMKYFKDNAEYLRANIDFDVTFVFFGCSGEFNSYGATIYAEKMDSNVRLNTAAMFNISKLGGERAYLYARDYKTEREDFLRSKAADCGYEFYSIPDNMPIIEAEYIEGVGYTHYGMIGDHSVFTEWGINSVSISSGYYGGFNIADAEKKGSINLSGTSADTYANLLKLRPDYAKQGSDAASLIISAVQSEGFISAMSAPDKDYSFWLEPLWAQLILLGVIVLLGVLVVVLVKVFEKKYPYKPVIKKMKIAVFGPEYESQNEDEILIDLKPNDSNNNPFDI